MRRRALMVLAAAAPLLPGAAGAQGAVQSDASIAATWTDRTRDRALPVRLRLPDEPGRRPVVLVSHGLGGSRDGLAYLGRALARAGFVAVHLQHPGTDASLWQGGAAGGALAMTAAAFDPQRALDRLRDGVFALDELALRDARPGDPLHGRLDLQRIAVAGHSYGAWTVQHLLGQRLPGGDRDLDLPDSRLRAGIALSPVPPRGLPARTAYARVAAPLLHLTGTEDRGYIEGVEASERLGPYRASANPAALAVLAGANHAAFAGEPAAGRAWNDPAFHPRIAALSVAFLRAVLLGDAAARAALLAGEGLAPGDRVEARGL